MCRRPSWQKRLTWLITVGCIAALTACGGTSNPMGDARPDGRLDASGDVRMDTGMDAERSDGMPATDVVDASDAGQSCTRSEDCAGNPAGSVCDTATGRCVQCISSMDTCPADQHCDDSTHTCVPGCRSDEGCTGTAGDGGTSASHCDTRTHTCVECVTNDHCPRGSLCMGNRCVMGCDTSDRCPTGQVCCEGGCVDTQTNADHCGACRNRCMVENGSAVCRAGRCAVGSCTAPYADCDGNSANGCETNTQTSVAHCGGCGMACPARANATSSCEMGVCRFTCEPGFADCNGDPADGCEVDTRSNTSHCGACGRACSFPNAVAACTAGMCVLASCNAGYGDCDGNSANGCEVNLTNSVSNCGRCGMTCPSSANATPTCTGARCSFTCNAGYGDCDGNSANGCETNVSSSVNNCGACGRVCSFPNASATCSGGTCALGTCNSGFGNCDGNAANGCETNLNSSVSNCGVCGRVCSFPNASATCSGGTCALGTCNSGFGNCDGNAANGCETNLNTSVTDCGACGRVCSFPNASATCSGGTCALGTCNSGFGNCDGNATNGCETSLTNNVSHCGACGRVCSFPNASAACSGGTCIIASCNAGWDNCDGNATNGCETNLNTSVTNCGRCGNVCALPNATAACSAGRCAIASCDPGWADCNGNASDGCETNINSSVTNCGACGRVCTVANGSPACVSGTCRIASCNPGWADCNSNPVDGCETSLNSNTNCGACGRVCGPGQVCSSGVCVSVCPPGTTYCSGACVNLNTDPNNCGACGRVCSFPNATAGCSGGVCTIASCNAGWGNCDGNTTNGCETNLNTSVTNCGACGRVCSFPNATAACSSGTCTIASCNAGWGNCDGNTTNGCETNLNTSNTNCGACGRACAAGQVCSGGTCVPSNDTRAGATVINMTVQQSLLSADTSTATNNTTGNCGCTSGRDVFFQFTIAAGQSEIVYADTVGATWDTSLFFQDGAGNNLTSANIPNGLVCNDDGGLSGCGTGLQSQVMALLGPGTYYLVLSGCGSGAVTIRFQHIPVGNGTLSFLPAGTNLTVSGTTSGTGRLSCGAGPENSYFWYSCPSYAGGSFSASTCSRASWDTKLEQVSPARGTSVCIDDTCSLQTTVTATIPSGPGIHALHIDGFCSTCAGSYSILYTRP